MILWFDSLPSRRANQDQETRAVATSITSYLAMRSSGVDLFTLPQSFHFKIVEALRDRLVARRDE